MNDEFLTQSPPPLSDEFIEKLYANISKEHEQPTRMFDSAIFRRTGWQVALVSLFLFAVTFTFSQPARGALLSFIREIAGFLFEEGGESPVPSNPTENAQITVYTLPEIDLAEARARMPVEFGIPTYLPDGYDFEDAAGPQTSKSWVVLSWRNPKADSISLLVHLAETYPDYPQPVAEGAIEEISINEHSGVLIRGSWHDDQWEEDGSITIRWTANDLVYSLSWRAGYSTNNLSIEELLQVAESIR